MVVKISKKDQTIRITGLDREDAIKLAEKSVSAPVHSIVEVRRKTFKMSYAQQPMNNTEASK